MKYGKRFKVGGALIAGLLAATCLVGATAAIAQDMRFGIEQEITTLDPAIQANGWDAVANVNVYDSLVRPHTEKGVISSVAESWDVSEGGLVYTFHLKHGLKFHDGSEVKADDVAYSMVRQLAISSALRINFRLVDPNQITVVDDYTVSFALTEPSAAFLKALVVLKIINKDLITANIKPGQYGDNGDYGSEFLLANDAGSGPYTAARGASGDRLVLTRFDDYSLGEWQDGAPATVDLITIPESVTIGNMLRGGEVDVATWALPVQVQKQIATDQRFVYQADAQPVPWIVVMNNARPPLDDVHVRRAIAHAYDSQTVIQHIVGGGSELRGPVVKSLLNTCDGVAGYPFDLEAAKAELAQSKYSATELAGFKMNIAAAASSERFKNIALMLSTNLKKIGLDAEVQAVRFSDIGGQQTSPETAYDFVVFYYGGYLPDASESLDYCPASALMGPNRLN